MSKFTVFCFISLGLFAIADPKPELIVDPDAPVTASELGWSKTTFQFELADDEVGVMQRVTDDQGLFFSVFRIYRGDHLPCSVLLKPEQGGSYTDDVGSGFSVSSNGQEEVEMSRQLSTSGDDATLKAQLGDFQCVWKFEKMDLKRAIELVPELEQMKTQKKFVFSGRGVILKTQE